VKVEPQRLDEASFFDFVAQPAPSVLFVSVHRIHVFSDALPQRLFDAGLEGTTFGRLALPDLLAAQRVLQFLAQAGVRCRTPQRSVLPGYYLFLQSELLAYHAGLPATNDANQLLRGAALGALLYGTTGRVNALLDTLIGAANGAASKRVAHDFADALAAHQAQPRDPQAAPHQASASELHWAYSTLGVLPSAPDDEVNRAWRKLRHAHHPDHAASDPEEFARRPRRSRELNHARDVIFAHRARAQNAA
jgi:hypothetical protein